MPEQAFDDSDPEDVEERSLDPAAIEASLRAGEWINTAQLGALFGRVGLSSPNRWLNKGIKMGRKRFAIRFRYTVSDERVCNPDDVLAVLEESRREYSADDPQPES